MTEEFKCKGCSKENTDKVPILRVINRLDEFFAKNDLEGAKELLVFWVGEAERINDQKGLLSVLNEQIGLYRRTAEKDKGTAAINGALSIIKEQNLTRGESVGTIYINIATTFKAFGDTDSAIKYYDMAEKIFGLTANIPDYKKAALLNNTAAAYLEIKAYEKAEQNYITAAVILEKHKEHYGEVAVTFVNLAHLYEDMGKDNDLILETVEKAIEFLNKAGYKKDGNYAFVCTKCAPSFEYFGFTDEGNYFALEAEKIYEGN